MRTVFSFPVSALAALLLALAAANVRAETPVPGRLLVHFKNPAAVRAREILNARKIDELETIGVRMVNVPPGTEAEAMKKLAADPGVEWVEPDVRVQLQLPKRRPVEPPLFLPSPFAPNDPDYSNQWAYPMIHAPEAWGITKSSPQVKIAILDSGICLDHPDLAAKVIVNTNFSDADTADDFFGHGTHVAGIAAAITDNGIGVAGTAGNASLMNVKVIAEFGAIDVSSLSQAVVWAANHGADVINMSLAFPVNSPMLHRAIQYAVNQRHVICVAASGDTGNAVIQYPAAYPEVISVGATDESDQIAGFSSYGNWVDVAAPGADIFSTGPDHANLFFLNDYDYLSGTSMSAPFVAGEAALLLSLLQQRHGEFAETRVRNVRDIIESTTDNNAALRPYCRHGRIDLYKAALAALNLHTPDLQKFTDSLAFPQNNQAAVSITLTNAPCSNGPANAGPFHVGFYFSTDPTFASLQPFYELAAEHGCAVNRSVTLTQTFSLDGIDAGVYYLGYKINDRNEVLECDESNNGILSWTVTISP